METAYLGDGLYGIYDGFNIWLHANSLEEPTDKVCLEPAVVAAFEQFIAETRNS